MYHFFLRKMNCTSALTDVVRGSKEDTAAHELRKECYVLAAGRLHGKGEHRFTYGWRKRSSMCLLFS